MANNEEGSSRPQEFRELEIAKKRYLECEPMVKKIQEFLKKKHGTLLEEQEELVKKKYRDDIFPILQNIRKLKPEISGDDSFNTPFCGLVNLIISGNGGIDSELIRNELIALSSALCRKLGGLELRFSSIIEVAPTIVTREIFQNLLAAFGDLQVILAGILTTYRGENDGSTLTDRMVAWASITGTLIKFLTEVILKLPGFGIEETYLMKINALLNRCIHVYSPDLFFGFVRAVGSSENERNYKEQIEDHQRDLGILIDEIKVLTGYP